MTAVAAASESTLTGIGMKVASVAVFVAMQTLIKAAGDVPAGEIVFFRSASSSSLNSTSTRRVFRSTLIRSPVFSSARFPPAAASGDAFRIEGLPEVPLCRPSPIVGNWFTSANPQSHFKNRFIVAKALPNGQRTHILNRDYVLRRGAETTTTEITSPEVLLSLLRDQFALEGFTPEEAAKLFALNPPKTQ